MKTVTKVLVSLVGMLTLALQNDQVSGFVSAMLASHPKVAAFVLGLSGILALVHVPAKQS